MDDKFPDVDPKIGYARCIFVGANTCQATQEKMDKDTMSSVLTFTHVEIPAPAAFSAAVNDKFLEKIKMKPIPVLFLRGRSESNWSGYCLVDEYTENGEVVIDARYVENRLVEPKLDTIKWIYIHECAHRLIPGAGHNAAFFAMNLLLLLRAGERHWEQACFYCIRDDVAFLPQAIEWAWSIAIDLYETEKTAEECAKIIMGRHAAWLKQPLKKIKDFEAAVIELKNRIKDLKKLQVQIFSLGFIAGLVFSVIGAFFLYFGSS